MSQLDDFQDWSNEPKRDWPFDFREERARHRRIERGLDVEDANFAHVGHYQQWHRGSHIQSKPRVGQITSFRNKVISGFLGGIFPATDSPKF